MLLSSRTLRCVLIGVAGTALVVLLPGAASAHVDLEATSSAVGTTSVLTFAIGHGCAGSPTTAVSIVFPAETPAVKPGWAVERTPAPVGSTTITYTAETPLEDHLRDAFDVAVLLSPQAEVGQRVALPTTQTCVEGVAEWHEVTTGGVEPSSPAPVLTLTAATEEVATETETETTVAGPVVSAGDGTARWMSAGGLFVGVVGLIVATSTQRRLDAERVR